MKTAVLVALAVLVASVSSAQYHQTDFPADEFRGRHARLFEQIGNNAVAVVQGMPTTEGFTYPRQHNTFITCRESRLRARTCCWTAGPEPSHSIFPRAIPASRLPRDGCFRPKTRSSCSVSRASTR